LKTIVSTVSELGMLGCKVVIDWKHWCVNSLVKTCSNHSCWRPVLLDLIQNAITGVRSSFP